MRFATSGAISSSMRGTSAVLALRRVMAGASVTAPLWSAGTNPPNPSRSGPGARREAGLCRSVTDGGANSEGRPGSAGRPSRNRRRLLARRDLPRARAHELGTLARREDEVAVAVVDHHVLAGV